MPKVRNEKNERQYKSIKINAKLCNKETARGEEVIVPTVEILHCNDGRMHKKRDTGWLIIV